MLTLPKEVEEALLKEAIKKGLDPEVLLLDKLSSSLDPKSRVKVYLEKSRELIQRAEKYLAEGDLAQASEKAWGGAPPRSRPTPRRRGLEHFRHRDLEEVVSRMITENKGDKTLIAGWGACLRLHSNFYEGFMTREDVEATVGLVKEFLERVTSLVAKG
ncbi:MAG: PaREP1 family protein [Thermoprotei archaeon]